MVKVSNAARKPINKSAAQKHFKMVIAKGSCGLMESRVTQMKP